MLLIEQNLGVAIDVADTHRRDGQRPHRARDAGGRARRPTASCSSGCSACAPAAMSTRSRRRPPAAAPARRRADAGLHGPARHGDGAPALDDPPRRARACAASPAGTPADTHGRRRAIADRQRRGAEPVDRDAPSLEAAAASLPRTGRRGARASIPGGGHQRPRRLRRRHLRHQGPRAALPAQLPGEARPAHRHGRPRDLGQAVAGHRCTRARWRGTIPAASARCSPATAARR